MGDHQHGSPLHRLLQSELHRRLGFSIKGTGGFIQQQQRRIAKHRPGNGDPLQLATGNIGSPFFELGVIPIGQGTDEIIRIGQARRIAHLVVRRTTAEPNRFGNGSGKHGCALRNQGHLLTQLTGAHQADVGAVETDLALLRRVEPEQKRQQGAFTRTGGANDGQHLARIHPQIQLTQHRLGWVIAKAHLIKNQITLKCTDGLRISWIRSLLGLSLDLPQTSQ